MKTIIFGTLSLLSMTYSASACPDKSVYSWNRETEHAEFPTGYNYPVFVTNGGLFAVRDTSWISADGIKWRETELPNSGLNSAFQKYVQFKDSVYAFGTMTGNSERMSLTSRIARTKDGRSWEVIAESSNLPKRVWYGATVFKDRIWIFGGTYQGVEYDDVWSSGNGVEWKLEADKMPWGKRSGMHAVVFKDRIYLIGSNDVWSSGNGIEWQLETKQMAASPIFVSGYSVAVFDGKIWLVGINRNRTFQSGALFSSDGKYWQEMSAPWTPRGAVAVWVKDDKLFMTGGKSSYVDNRGETQFVYSNDVWSLSKKTMLK